MSIDPSFHSRYGPSAVIAGASEGIGFAFADALAEKGLDLIVLARRRGPLEDAAHRLRRRHGVSVDAVPMDLASADVETQFESAIEGRDVGLLIYNACHSTIGPYAETPLAQKLTTLDVNCRGPLVLSSIISERLLARGRGGLLIMSSLSGQQGTANLSTYAATKAFDTVLAGGLWAELSPRGIDVLGCVAGATRTPNFEAQTPESKQEGVMPMTPEAVARGALENLGRGPIHVAGSMNRAVATALRVAPRRGAVAFMRWNMERIYG